MKPVKGLESALAAAGTESTPLTQLFGSTCLEVVDLQERLIRKDAVAGSIV